MFGVNNGGFKRTGNRIATIEKVIYCWGGVCRGKGSLLVTLKAVLIDSHLD